MSRPSQTTAPVPGSAWSDEEEIQLCKSWKFVCHDPATGTEMQATQMWKKITQHFAAHIAGTIRNKGALMSHWRGLSKELVKWKDALNKAKENTGSGYALEDEIRHAQLWYGSKGGNSFTHFGCWEVVKDCEKFQIVQNKDPTPTPNDFINDSIGEDESMEESHGGTPVEVNLTDASDIFQTPPSLTPSSSTRPQGRKAAKASRKQSPNPTTIVLDTFAKNSAIRIEEARKREEVRLAERAKDNELMVMSMDTSQLTPNAKAYWAEERQKITNRRRLFREAQSSSSANTNWFAEE